MLRDALETPGARAALVTPDRELAGRVAAELLRHGVVADDSAGEPLADTPPAVFLRLLTRAVAEELAPVPLLALLKHPLAAAGLSPAACRAAARALEKACLRGPRPAHGLTGLRRALDRAAAPPEAADLLRRLEACLAPTLRIAAGDRGRPRRRPHRADRGRRTPRRHRHNARPLPALGRRGRRRARHHAVRDPGRRCRCCRTSAARCCPGLLDAVLQGQVVRSRRALRGRGGTEHPRVFIWGLLEARLQTADTLVLGGLVEGVWPPATDPGPWLSRPMRGKVGLASPEQAVGQAAHDFLAAANAAPQVVLSCPARRDGAPAVPARWLTRLEMFLAGHDQAAAGTPGRRLGARPGPARGPPAPGAAAAALPAGGAAPAPAQRHRDRDLAARPLRDLRPPRAEAAPRSSRSTRRPTRPITAAWCMTACGIFLAEHGTRWPPGAAGHLRRAMARALAEAGLREALAAWWAPRLDRIADWVADTETARRAIHRIAAIAAEVKGTSEIPRDGGRVRPGRPRRPHRAPRPTARWPSSTTRPARRRPRRRSMPAWRRSFCWRRRWRKPARSVPTWPGRRAS